MTRRFQKLKKLFSIITITTILLGYVPMGVFAADGDAYLTGQMDAGKNVSNGSTVGNWAGTFFITIEPESRTDPANYKKVYCVDFHTNWGPGELHAPDGDITDTRVVWILNNYYPTVPGKPEGLSTEQKASAVQLAIWHFTDGLDLTETSSENDKAVFNAARTIISLAQTAPIPQTPSDLTITVTPATGYVGEEKTVEVLVLDQNNLPIANQTVTIKITGSVTKTETVVTNALGIATTTYTSNAAGQDTIEASVEYTVPAGLRWAKKDRQKLIMAEQVPGVIRKETTTTTWSPAVSGYKYHDLNANGVWDTDEPAIEGVTINLTNATGASISEITDIDGFYLFENVKAGTYTLTENIPTGWFQSQVPATFTIAANESKTDQNFGNYQKVTVTACKKIDSDGNLETTTDQTNKPGWGMTLNGDNTSTIGTTGENGCVTWNNLLPGNYSVTEENRDGWTNLNDLTHSFGYLPSGSAAQTHTFYNFQNGYISGYKYQNSIANENKLNGWTIRLSYKNSDLTPNCPTPGIVDGKYCKYVTGSEGNKGNYIFRNLKPGTYIVEEELQTGWVQIQPANGNYEVVMTNNGAKDGKNFVNEARGTINLMKLVNGEVDKTWDLNVSNYPSYINGTVQEVVAGTYTISEEHKDGYHVTKLTCNGTDYGAVESKELTVNAGDNIVCTFENVRDTGAIQAYKFEDLDGDGKYDDGEPKIEWGIHVTGQNDVAYANGGYLWDKLPTGEYTVSEDSKSGWIPTTLESQNVSVASGQTVVVYFGNFECGKISGYKWEDLNGNSNWETTTESAIADWQIVLSDGQTTKTDANGYYEFTVCKAGNYEVKEIISDSETWYQTSPKDANSYHVTIASGTEATNNNFGNAKYGKILGVKYRDNEGDGNLDAGDLLDTLAGWTINLIDPESGAVVASTTSGANGSFEFHKLPVGNVYTLEEVLTPGWTQTVKPAGTVKIESSGFSTAEQQFGNFENVSITACKLEDLDGKTETATDRIAVRDWNMTLIKDGNEIETQPTNEDGCYTWTNLEPGDYSVTEEERTDWKNLDDLTHSFGVVQSGGVYEYSFVNFHNVKLSGYKFEDVDADGIWDTTEKGLSGWTIKLSDGRTVVTDANGYYEFTNVTPGTYTLEEVLKTGWYQTVAPSAVTIESGKDVGNLNFGNFDKTSVDGELTKDVEKGLYEYGETVSYTITVENPGPVAIVGTLSDVLPDGLSFKSSSTTPDTVNSQQMKWNLKLNPSSVLVITVTATIDADYEPLAELVNNAIFNYWMDPSLGIVDGTKYELKDDAKMMVKEIVKKTTEGEVLGVETKEEEGKVLSATGMNIVPVLMLAFAIVIAGKQNLKKKKLR